ncbi:MAG: class A beta-lactamase-related serine hydrolase [Cyclobacteriaceae bacterium]|nr:class A beta-lactamase-related serine hydrolase [Cyclobacteriaceae bacterium]MCX7636352.1 class A beta-lactamase-related serine hydrolase [Cyclobacteriaceae bacterium]MDW8330291.1 serine hydrolase [Cyclobacteriaceae bacterium]
MLRISRYFFSGLLLFSCTTKKSLQQLESSLHAHFGAQQGTFAVAFKDISTGETLLINENEVFHAASTMKTPVMIEVYKQAAEGRWKLTDSVPVINTFTSIADGSTFSLNPEDDSEKELYKMIGKKRTVYDLVYDMIIVSSNLATNIVIEYVDAKKVTQTMRELGAPAILVLRGVEDNKAYQLGMNNTTTAYDLMVIFEKIATGEAVNPEASAAMIKILLDQRFNEIIPALLPKEVKVAHKTGMITGVHHDSGIVMLPDGRKYVLVLLSKNLEDIDRGTAVMAQASKMIYDYVVQ